MRGLPRAAEAGTAVSLRRLYGRVSGGGGPENLWGAIRNGTWDRTCAFLWRKPPAMKRLRNPVNLWNRASTIPLRIHRISSLSAADPFCWARRRGREQYCSCTVAAFEKSVRSFGAAGTHLFPATFFLTYLFTKAKIKKLSDMFIGYYDLADWNPYGDYACTSLSWGEFGDASMEYRSISHQLRKSAAVKKCSALH